MAVINSYYLYQKYEKRGNQPWIQVYPSTYSVDGDGTMPLVIKELNDPYCNAQYRTITTGTTCSDANKYVLNEFQVSYDDGTTWTTISSSTGSIIESNSYDCGYRTGTTTGTPYCDGYDKYIDVYSRESRDYGDTWITASTTPILVEAQSEDCGYVPTQYRWTPSGYTCVGYDKYQNNIKEQSTDGGVTWTVVIPAEYSASTLIEANSQDCGYTDPQYEYLTLIPLEDTTFTITSRTQYPPEFEYSLDDGTSWVTWSGTSQATTDTIQANQKMRVRCIGGAYYASVGTISSTGRFNLFGNIMSLIDTYNFSGRTTLGNYDVGDVFMYLFQNARVVNAENLVLPLLQFKGNGTDREYYGMFKGCTEMVKPPKELPATSLEYQCYHSMFSGCTSITESPIIRATSFGYSDTCARMFENCSSLSKITCYATYNSTFNRYSETFNWVNGVAENGTFYKASTATKWQEGVNGIPSGWTIVDIS